MFDHKLQNVPKDVGKNISKSRALSLLLNRFE